MGVVFTENRSLPKEIRQLGHYRGLGDNMNTESAVADIFRSLTTGAVDFFGGSSSAAKQAAAEAARAQAEMNAQIYGTQALEEGRTKRTLIWVGAGVAGLLLLSVIVSKRSSMSGYRKKRRSRR